MSWQEEYENYKNIFIEFVAEHTPTAPTDLGEDQKTPDDQGIVPTVVTVVSPEYVKTSNEIFGNSNFYSTKSAEIGLPEVLHFDKNGLKSDMNGNAIMNPDGTYTDREGHTIMSDKEGNAILAKDAPEYYSWYKPPQKDIGSTITKLTDDWEYGISPDSTIGNDRELTEEDKKNGYHLETKLGVQFRVDNLDKIHPEDLPDYLELEDHHLALFSHIDNVLATAKDGNIAQDTKSSSDPLEFRFAYFQSDGTPVYYATSSVIVQGSRIAEDGNVSPNNGIINNGQAKVENTTFINLDVSLKQALKLGIAQGILPNPVTMERDYKFIEGGVGLAKYAGISGGFIIDKTGNVYVLAEPYAGYAAGLPFNIGEGYFGNTDKSDKVKYREALEGYSFGTTTGAGIQGNASIGTGGVISGEVSLSPSIGKTFSVRRVWFLFNIYDD